MQTKRLVLSLAISAALSVGLSGCDDDDTSTLRATGLNKLSQLQSESEIVDYANVAGTHYMYSIGGDNKLRITNITAPGEIAATAPIVVDLSAYGDAVQSVTATDEMVAVAMAPEDKAGSKGSVAFFDSVGNYQRSVEVGYLPDMVTFNESGSQVVVANEGEPSDDYQTDPGGSVGIIDTATYSYTDLALDGTTTAAADGTEVRLGDTPSNDQSKDLEPEYITVSGDYAYVTLQENNALAKVNLSTKSVEFIKSLGVKSYDAASGNTIDIEEEGEIRMKSYEGLYGLYMPDTITSTTIGGKTYLLTANEGDGREYIYEAEVADEAACDALEGDWDEGVCEVLSFIDEEKISKLDLADAIADQYADENDLKVITDWGKNSDGEYEALYTYGARSFTIWDEQGDLVFDSGDQISKLIAEHDPTLFNQDDGDIDGRSGNKGGEPEAITVGQVGDKHYAFVGLERQSVIVTFDITDPTAPTFVDYHKTHAENNLSPEGMKFITAEQSPNGKPLLLVAFEYGTDTAPQAAVVYEVTTAE